MTIDLDFLRHCHKTQTPLSSETINELVEYVLSTREEDSMGTYSGPCTHGVTPFRLCPGGCDVLSPREVFRQVSVKDVLAKLHPVRKLVAK